MATVFNSNEVYGGTGHHNNLNEGQLSSELIELYTMKYISLFKLNK